MGLFSTDNGQGADGPTGGVRPFQDDQQRARERQAAQLFGKNLSLSLAPEPNAQAAQLGAYKVDKSNSLLYKIWASLA